MAYKFDAGFLKRIIERMQSSLYITDPVTHEILYTNGYIKDAFHCEKPEGKYCWEILQKDMKGPCSFCKIPDLYNKELGEAVVWREHNEVSGRDYINYDWLEEWNGRRYHIQNSVDITSFLQLSIEASIDELTGLLNRNAGKNHLSEVLSSLKEDGLCTVALCDLNGLKWVNDTYGHLEGDRFLKVTACTMQEGMEASDFAFRLSGDEFILVFQNKDSDQAAGILEEILARLKERRQSVGIDYEATFSYGLVTVNGGHRLSVSDVLSVADMQMYIRKRDYHILSGKQAARRLSKEAATRGNAFSYHKDQLLDALSESIDDYIFVGNLKTGEFRYTWQMAEDFGLPGQVVKNAASFWKRRIHPDDARMFLDSNQEIADGRADRHAIVYRAKAADGTWKHLLCRGRMYRDGNGRPELFAGVIRNLDKEHEKSLMAPKPGIARTTVGQKELDSFLTTAIIRASKGSADKPLGEKELLFSFRFNLTRERLEELWGVDEKLNRESSDRSLSFLLGYINSHIASEDDRKRFGLRYNREEILRDITLKRAVPSFEFREKDREGRIRWARMDFHAVRQNDGDLLLYGYARNIDEQKKRELALEYKAGTDIVSGFYDQTTVRLMIQSILENKNSKNGIHATLILDMDDFSKTGKNWFRGEKEEVLRQASTILRSSLPPLSVAGRLEQDVFLIFYFDISSADEIREEAGRLRRLLCRTYQAGDELLYMSWSAGLCCSCEETVTYDQLYHRSLKALERAKYEGKDQMKVYGERSETAERQKLSWELLRECFKIGDTGIIPPAFGEAAAAQRLSFIPAEEASLLWERLGARSGQEQVFEAEKREEAAYGELEGLLEETSYQFPLLWTGCWGDCLTGLLVAEGVWDKKQCSRVLREISGFVGKMAQYRLMQEKYSYVMTHDRESGLLNYQSYIRCLSHENQEIYSSMGVAGIHIWDFKGYNQRYGHAGGDRLLAQLGEKIREIFKGADCYRISGAGFLIRFADVTKDRFEEQGRRFQMEAETLCPGQILCEYVWTAQVQAPMKLQQQVEEKLQIAMNQRSTRAYGGRTPAAARMLSELKQAIKRGGFTAFFQPKADLKTGRICGAEALVRYQHGRKGVITPDKFLPEIEKAGLIRYIDLFVLEESCRLMRQWLDEGWEGFPVSLNYSRITILEPGILEETCGITDRYRIPHRLISIEITETISAVDNISLKAITTAFTEAGYGISLDDFGTEYSNIHVLYDLPIKILKIDRSIVTDMFHNPKAGIVAQSVFAACKSLKIRTVAEGVETKEQADILKEMGCDMIQGYYINKPLPSDCFKETCLSFSDIQK